MPTYLKIILTLLVGGLTFVMYKFELQIGNEPIQYFVLGLGVFMILALWLFPEAGKRPNEK